MGFYDCKAEAIAKKLNQGAKDGERDDPNSGDDGEDALSPKDATGSPTPTKSVPTETFDDNCKLPETCGEN